MAAPQAHLRAGRYFLALLVLLAIIYALVFLTGSTRTPKLGLDLEGGTTVTLAAKTANGQPPSTDAMNTAREIIQSRVNGRGIASAEVVIQGSSDIVISVPGDNGDQAKTLGSTALLRFRPVLQTFPVTPPASTAPPSATPSGSVSTGSPTHPTASPTASAKVGQSPTTSPSPGVRRMAPTAAPKSTASPTPTATGTGTAAQYPGATPEQVALLTKLNCKDQQVSVDDPKAQIAACSQDGTVKYVLDKVVGEDEPGKTPLEGTQIANAQAVFDQQDLQGWVVLLDFKSGGQATWSEYTAANIGKQVAFTLDGKVVSAPQITTAINGPTQVTGNFDQNTASDLANALKYGALPLTFVQQNAMTISPTLGTDQLKAGLLAGGIGLILVVAYSLLYYRALGLVTIASLVVSGLLTYGALVILGRQIGFTLTLAGIAGFIVAVGITADSFVVFFERLKDEVRDGRTGRSAIPRAWVRARRTILSADAVSFLAAAILYYLAAGDVKGFAFTLGLSTILDLVVVFLFTHPLIAVAARSKSFTSPRFSGLGAFQPKKNLAPAGAQS